MPPSKVQFHPRWKEELVCTMDGHQFIVELTMGVLTVYFPTKERWQASAPEWAKGHWDRVHEDLSAWCEGQGWPLKIEENAWVQFQ